MLLLLLLLLLLMLMTFAGAAAPRAGYVATSVGRCQVDSPVASLVQ